jgi:hypothetical protein
MVRILLNIQLLFYGMTYLMILEKLPILTNLKTFYTANKLKHTYSTDKVSIYKSKKVNQAQ